MNEKNENNTVSEDLEKELSIDDLNQVNGGSPTTSTSTLNADRGGGHTASPAINAYLQN
jgi:bacteriocin-like protein